MNYVGFILNPLPHAGATTSVTLIILVIVTNIAVLKRIFMSFDASSAKCHLGVINPK